LRNSAQREETAQGHRAAPSQLLEFHIRSSFVFTAFMCFFALLIAFPSEEKVAYSCTVPVTNQAKAQPGRKGFLI
jgi:hypothetical protein